LGTGIMNLDEAKALAEQHYAKPKSDAVTGALVWKDVVNAGGGRCFEAPAARGFYSVYPLDGGYSVIHRPHATDMDQGRGLGSRFKTVEQAKAIAQADHDGGGDVL
jgi:hypothetical protein